MNEHEVARAVELILRGKGKPVPLWVRRVPGGGRPEVTSLIPVGRATGRLAGSFTPDITLAELRADLKATAAELSRGAP